MEDQRIEKWTGWIEGTIKHNVLTMHLQRMAWREVSEILAAKPRASANLGRPHLDLVGIT